MSEAAAANVKRITELGKREATVLEHEGLRVIIDDEGGMIPEFSSRIDALDEKAGNGVKRLNAHWLPWFRSNSGEPFDKTKDGSFWKGRILHHLAGNFPCLPNFGGDCNINGVDLPAHGWTANLPWKFVKSGVSEGTVWALSTMESPDNKIPLSFRKIDALAEGQNIHYTSVVVKNSGNEDIDITAAWHNTIGAPFLAKGGRISSCADAWITAPKGSEFDTTSRFILGEEFPDLYNVPLLKGGKADISIVPGPIGYTDFAVGRVPESLSLGWSAFVNPSYKMTYISFFTGSSAAASDDIILRFNNLWMQYGGRNFTPWAAYEGGTDLTFCLGAENSISAYAEGLEYSRRVKKVLDTPTTVNIPAGEERVLRYGTLFAPYKENTLDEGVISLEGEKEALVCKGKNGHYRFAADPGFDILKKLEKNY